MLEYTDVKVEVYLPHEYIDLLISALTEIGACVVGAYDHVSSYSPVEGTWRPLPGSQPFHGEAGVLCHAKEYKLEFRCGREHIKSAVDAIRRIHPYEEPVVNILPLLSIENCCPPRGLSG